MDEKFEVKLDRCCGGHCATAVDKDGYSVAKGFEDDLMWAVINKFEDDDPHYHILEWGCWASAVRDLTDELVRTGRLDKYAGERFYGSWVVVHPCPEASEASALRTKIDQIREILFGDE